MRDGQATTTGRRTLLVWLIALPLLAAGCATPGAPGAGLPGSFEASRWAGRFAVTMTEPGADPRVERASGRFLIESRAGSTLLELLSPLGQTMATARLKQDRAELLTAEGRLFEADSAEELTERVFGWRMPVGDLPRWLRGLLDSPTETAGGRPLAGSEHGWAIRLDDWRPSGPARLNLDWPAGPPRGRPEINLKLIVDDAS